MGATQPTRRVSTVLAVAASNAWLDLIDTAPDAEVSPLLRATVTGELPAVIELLEAGATTSVATPIDIRLARGILMVVAASAAPGATDTVPDGASTSEPVDRLLDATRPVAVDALLLDAGADPTTAVDGWSPLDAAQYGGWSNVVMLLEQ